MYRCYAFYSFFFTTFTANYLRLMQFKRRSFLKNASVLAGTAFLSSPIESFAAVNKSFNNLTKGNTISIFHTAELNGKINSNTDLIGGLQEIRTTINQLETSGLIVDAGNFMNKSFSPEMIYQMNKTGYHAATFGANELILGAKKFEQLITVASFPIVNCNYTFESPSRVRPYLIVYSGKLKIGITGVSPEMNTTGLTFNDPYICVNKITKTLKEQEGCDLVICLSSLQSNDKKFNNQGLAATSKYLDFIIGTKGDKVQNGALILQNANRQEVIVSTASYKGMTLGKTTFGFSTDKIRNHFDHEYLVPGSPFKKGSLQAQKLHHQLMSGLA